MPKENLVMTIVTIGKQGEAFASNQHVETPGSDATGVWKCAVLHVKQRLQGAWRQRGFADRF